MKRKYRSNVNQKPVMDLVGNHYPPQLIMSKRQQLNLNN